MSDRPCSKCIWNTVNGCSSWDCEPVLRSEIRQLIKDYGPIEKIKAMLKEVDDG